MSHIRLSSTVRRRGAVAVLVAVLLIPIVGILAIALDGGMLLDNHRRAQAACDAASLAAATELFVNYPAIESSDYTLFDPYGAGVAAALESARNNGFPNDNIKSSTTVNIPPQSGPFAGKSAYAEVILICYQKRFFSGIWGTTRISVPCRAVARGRWAGSKQGILALHPNLKSSLNASGTGAVTVTGGAAVIVDSNNGLAAAATGGGGITAANFEITGGYTGALNGEIHTGVPPTPDPLRYLPAPDVPPNGTMTVENVGQGNKKYTLSPGRYNNLPNFNAGDIVVLRQASANGAGGVFYIDGGGFKSTGASIIMDTNTSGGVMIYNHPTSSAVSHQIQISGNSSGTVNLSALTDGPYAGLLVWQQRTAAQQMSISGGGNFTLKGTFYAANAELQITGNGDATIGSQYISSTLNIGGNGRIIIDYTDDGTARLREAILVE
jgi:hypothetical protein